MSDKLRSLPVILLVALLLGTVGGCSTDVDLASRRDGSASPDAHEECGNGMDDDADGRIDEDCPCGEGEQQGCFAGVYPNRLIGACRDGLQRCVAADGAEFGRWALCVGDTRPVAESCDGFVDENCDGAIDEGCACEGDTIRECGTLFEGGECRSGSQSCVDGLWTGCEGANGPSAELCSDDLDNDCDGRINEHCDCVPSPEVCGDGLDNDCDTQVDEPGSCGVIAESCGDGVDNDQNGLIDENCAPGCDVGDVVYDRLFYRDESLVKSYYWERVFAAWTGTETAIAWAGGPEVGFTTNLVFERYDVAGQRISHDVLAEGSSRAGPGPDVFTVRSLLFTGEHYLLAYSHHDDDAVLRLGLDGRPLGPAIPLGGRLHWNGRFVGRLWTEPKLSEPLPDSFRRIYFRRYDSDLSPVGPIVPIVNDEHERRYWKTDLSSMGDNWIIAANSVHSTENVSQGRLWTYREETLISEEIIDGAQTLHLAAGATDALVVYDRLVSGDGASVRTAYYRFLDSTGRFAGSEVTLVSVPALRTIDLGVVFGMGGYWVFAPGVLGIPDTTQILHVASGQGATVIPLPPELTEGAENGWTYFFRNFGQMSSRPSGLTYGSTEYGSVAIGSDRGFGRVRMGCP